MLISSVWRGGSGWTFGLGLLVGGATTSLLAMLLGSLTLRPWAPTSALVSALLLILAVAAINDLGIYRLPMPQNARQVPERVARIGPWFGALQFGFEMGTGARTFMTSALPHVALVSVLFLASPAQALFAGLGFGLGRSLVPLSRRLSPGGDAWTDVFGRYQRPVQAILLGGVATSVAALTDALLN